MIRDIHLFPGLKFHVKWSDIGALFKSIWILGFMEKGKRYYWKLFFYSLFRYPDKFPMTITLAIYGFHFRKIAEEL